MNYFSRVTETRFNIVTRRLISNYINWRDVGETGDIISDIFTLIHVCLARFVLCVLVVCLP